MNDIVSFDKLCKIKETILSLNNEYALENQYLNEQICEQYDVISIKKRLLKFFEEFKSAKYLFEFPVEEISQITSNYGITMSAHLNNNVSKVESSITRYVDKQLRTTNIYNSILLVVSKLTKEEVEYFTNTFLNHKSEEEIAYQIGISKTALQKYKKSYIIKTWIEMEKYFKQD